MRHVCIYNGVYYTLNEINKITKIYPTFIGEKVLVTNINKYKIISAGDVVASFVEEASPEISNICHELLFPKNKVKTIARDLIEDVDTETYNNKDQVITIVSKKTGKEITFEFSNRSTLIYVYNGFKKECFGVFKNSFIYQKNRKLTCERSKAISQFLTKIFSYVKGEISVNEIDKLDNLIDIYIHDFKIH